MALTKITPQMFDTSAAGHDFNIDNGTFVVDASANRVGIGTATPSTLLHILTASNGASTVGSASDELILENSGDAGLTIRSGSSSDGVISFADADDHNIGQVYYSHSNNTMTFRTNDAIAATINSSGVVTASAGFVGPLTGNVTGNVSGTAATVTGAAQTNITSVGTLTGLTTTGNLVGTTATFSDTVTIDAADGDADEAYVLAVRSQEATAGRNYGMWVRAGSNSSDESFSVRNFDNSSMYFKVRGDGNVGIGETSPSAKFHIKKTAASTQHYDQFATAIIEDTEARLQIVASEGGSNAAGLLLTNEAKHWGVVHHGTGNSNIFSIGYYASSSSGVDLSDNLSDILNITTAGNVGIGTSSPNSYGGYTALTINGTNGGLLDFETNGTFVGEVYADGTNGLGLQSVGSRHIKFVTNGAERMRVGSSGELQIGGTSNAGFVDFDGTNLQLNTQRNPNTGAFVNTSRAHAGITLSSASANSHIKFYTTSVNNSTASVRMLLDRYGTLAVGTQDTHAWSTFDGKFRIGARGIVATTTTSTQIGHNWYYNGGYKYIGADYASRIIQSSGYVSVETATNGSADGAITFDEKFKIRNDGKVDIKLNSNAFGTFADNIGEVGSGNFCLQVANSAQNALKPLGFRAEEIKFATGSATRGYFNSSGHLVLGSSSHADDLLYLVRSNAGKLQRFYVGSDEQGWIGAANGDLNINGGPSNHSGMRFQATSIMPRYNNADSNGTVDLGLTSNKWKDIYASNYVYALGIWWQNDTDTGMYRNDTDSISFRVGGNDYFTIDGDASTYTHMFNSGTYSWYVGTSGNTFNFYDGGGTQRGYVHPGNGFVNGSDRAYKENISDITYGLETVKKLQPRKFKFKDTVDMADDSVTYVGEESVGFIAQELEQEIPELVMGEDGTKTVAYSQLTAVLTKAIQEQQALIEALQTEVAALKGG